MTAFELATKLPFSCYLRVGRESDPGSGDDFLSAVIMEEPPESGVLGDTARVGVSARSPEALEALAIPMLEHFLASRESEKPTGGGPLASGGRIVKAPRTLTVIASPFVGKGGGSDSGT